MRQAGRYLPEYRALRQKHSLLELCHHPELAAQVTLQPVERLGVDAAILFADILLPFEPLGLGLSFAAGEGPHITRPIHEATQVLELPRVDPATDLAYVMDAARLAARALPPHVPLIGFAGAPFTLASYAIEGGATRSFTLTKRFMYTEPRAWHELMLRLAELVGAYLAAQARAGARAAGARRAPPGRGPCRPHLQPRARRAAGDPGGGAAACCGLGPWRLRASPCCCWRTAGPAAWMTWSPTCRTCAAAGRRLPSSWRRSRGAMRASAAARPSWSGPKPRRRGWVARSGPRGPSTSGCATGIRSSRRPSSAWSPVANGVWWRSCSRRTTRRSRSARTRKSCSTRRAAASSWPWCGAGGTTPSSSRPSPSASGRRCSASPRRAPCRCCSPRTASPSGSSPRGIRTLTSCRRAPPKWRGSPGSASVVSPTRAPAPHPSHGSGPRRAPS